MQAIRLLGLLVPLAALVAQQPQKPPDEAEAPTIKVDVDVVNILCSVRDKRGGLISDLTKDDFALSEDGKAQQIRYFTRQTDLPLTLGLLVDVSLSQERLIDIEKQAASQFFHSVLRPKDLAFLISFGKDAELMQDLTSSPRLLSKALDDLHLNADVGGLQPGPVPTANHPRGTVLFDAVYLASKEELAQQAGRKALILITDGVDVGSRLKLKDAIEAAQKADAIVYSIYYVDRSAYGFGGFGGGVSDSDLKRMSEETGGRVFRVSNKMPLSKVFDDLQAEMRSQYAIGYTPINTNKDGAFREVDVRTKQKDLKVQARKGYYAVAGPAD